MENSPDDYNSKVSKLLNNFSDDMDVDADLLTQPRNVKVNLNHIMYFYFTFYKKFTSFDT